MNLTRADCLRLNIPWPDFTPPKAAVPRRGRMNGLESRFAAECLEPMRIGGEILGYSFEPTRLLIADAGVGTTRAYYTPDFISWAARCRPIFWEIKGHWREAARVRIKVAADRHPWAMFVAVRFDKGWSFEEFGGRS